MFPSGILFLSAFCMFSTERLYDLLFPPMKHVKKKSVKQELHYQSLTICDISKEERRFLINIKVIIIVMCIVKLEREQKETELIDSLDLEGRIAFNPVIARHLQSRLFLIICF